MCGIAGMLSFNAPIGPGLILAMTQSLRHRGPDDEGYLAADLEKEPIGVLPLHGAESRVREGAPVESSAITSRLYLGHRRLAILDLSEAGHQPMTRGHLSIVFNGEIYNYLELREELKAAGKAFRTETDTEVILAAYEAWGEDCVSRFNGDWAFALLDGRRGTLFLSRDRYGIKPLYYVKSGAYFAFASEIKALFALPFLKRALNRQRAFDHCVLLCRDHTDETLYENVNQLQPAHNLHVDIFKGELRRSRYYSLDYCQDLGRYDAASARKFAEQVRELLTDAIKLRLRADVAVGTCLSGGLDSSAVAAIASRLLQKEGCSAGQNTFTAAFPGESFDESRFARLVVQHTGAAAHWIYPSQQSYSQALDAVMYQQDEAFAGPSVYAQWQVMEEAGRHVKVVLDGQGGDEVFAGYRDYHTSFLANLLLAGQAANFAKELLLAVRNASSFKTAFAQLKSLPFFFLGGSLQRKIYRVRFRDHLRVAQEFGAGSDQGWEHLERKFGPRLNDLLFHYLTAYSLPHLLKYEDRNSMGNSIEARVPFTDYRLVNYVFSLPAAYKIHNGWTKWLLRLAVKDLLPPEIVWRKDKLGFVAPRWASRGELWNSWIKLNFRDAESRAFSTLATAA